MPSKMKVLEHLGAILWLRQKFKPEVQIIMEYNYNASIKDPRLMEVPRSNGM